MKNRSRRSALFPYLVMYMNVNIVYLLFNSFMKVEYSYNGDKLVIFFNVNCRSVKFQFQFFSYETR
jgi:hypothetical protein